MFGLKIKDMETRLFIIREGFGRERTPVLQARYVNRRWENTLVKNTDDG